MSKKQKTIVLIDDHDIVRKGLKKLIESVGDYKVIGEYQNGLSFVKALPELKETPDLFVLDYSMPMMNGVEVLQEALKEKDDHKFLMLTQHLDETIINDAYQNGARGFLHKTCNADQLKQTIDNITTYGYNNVTDILKRIRNVQDVKPKQEQSIQFSERELQLMELVCDQKEHTYQQIADIMNVSIKTVDKYRSQLFTKLNVKSKVGIVLHAHKHKLTTPFKDD